MYIIHCHIHFTAFISTSKNSFQEEFVDIAWNKWKEEKIRNKNIFNKYIDYERDITESKFLQAIKFSKQFAKNNELILHKITQKKLKINTDTFSLGLFSSIFRFRQTRTFSSFLVLLAHIHTRLTLIHLCDSLDETKTVLNVQITVRVFSLSVKFQDTNLYGIPRLVVFLLSL